MTYGESFRENWRDDAWQAGRGNFDKEFGSLTKLSSETYTGRG
ncbi:hypothetical protein [Thalassoroseus pseudoceratinae]|nr:hypothetical protein [Thalassoroseus pseudoceratinae]